MLASAFASEVDRRLNLPASEQKQYAETLSKILIERQISESQYVVLVDRCEMVQALMIFWLSPEGTLQLIGASPVSTGKPGTFDHSKTPVGIFEHTTDNLDFRAEGTRNENGIRGYGLKGMRVYDFGWQKAVQGWGHRNESEIRLQMHATDPVLEKRLGTAQSKGCVRIPASLNAFIDRYGILDAGYDLSLAEGASFWVLSKTRMPTPWSGRFLIVIDSERKTRPGWSPLPGSQKPSSVTSLRGTNTRAADATENRTAAHNTPLSPVP